MSGKALLIGIDDYGRHINEQDAADALPDLSHCLNDVANVKRLLLNQFGFSSRRIKVLPDRKATRAAIVEQLTWLAAGARDGDHLVFFFSGHGRLDHQRQVLCPHDMSWSPKTFITDADLAVFLRRLPEFCSVEAILDCCYSGQAGERDQALRPKPQQRAPTAGCPDFA